MATSTPRHFACENGHPVREGSTVCVTCGAQVTTRPVAAPPASVGTRGASATREVAPQAPAPNPPPASAGPIASARRRALIASTVGGVVALAGAAFAIALGASSDDQTPDSPGGTGLRAACGGLANAKVEVGVALLDAPAIVCFEVTTEVTLTVGAASTAGIDLILNVENDQGVFWAGADDTIGTDPEVTTTFLPGTYVVAVAEYGDSAPGDFDFYTRVEEGPTGDLSLPRADACDGLGVPLITVGGSTTAEGVTAPNVCLEVTEAAFIKVGLIGDPVTHPDLNLAIHTFRDGQAVFLRSVDDSVGVDPEMNLELESGLYLLEVWAMGGTPLGSFTVYADDTRTYFRTGEVSAPFANLTASDCTGAAHPSVVIDGEATLPDGVTVACVTIPDVRRVALGARSGSNQDLTLEIIGFDSDGTPVQYGTVDDDLWSVNLEDYDPRLDIVLPAGTYALGVADFGGAMPTNVVVFVEDLDR